MRVHHERRRRPEDCPEPGPEDGSGDAILRKSLHARVAGQRRLLGDAISKEGQAKVIPVDHDPGTHVKISIELLLPVRDARYFRQRQAGIRVRELSNLPRPAAR